MAWIRLSDNYIDNPKVQALSDGAFRLWHEGLAFCRRHLTDGMIPFSALRGFKSYSKTREKQLAATKLPDRAPLWEPLPHTGYKVHDYLEWNQSREEEEEHRTISREQMRTLRQRRRAGDRPPVKTNISPTTRDVASPTTRVVADMDTGTDHFREKGCGEKPDDRAGRLLQELYPAWYAKYRRGARLVLVANTLDFQAAIRICETWDDQRIERLAQIVLTTDDPFISGTDRSFKIFVMKASWADDRLRQAESVSA
jgi:hypothetical protein